MKILFICGSCEPSRDGVGDYTCKLAVSLSEREISCTIIAINDSYVKEIKRLALHGVQRNNLVIVRVPASWSGQRKTQILEAETNLLNPDWISLQYVPYSFNQKGFVWELFIWLSRIRSTARWHMMAHELWVDPNESIRNWIVAPIQKLLLAYLIIYLKTKVIHTSNCYYINKLYSVSVRATRLPLFSNIAVHRKTCINTRCDHGIRIVFFGSIHAEWKPSCLIHALADFANESSIRPITLVSIGNAGGHGKRIWEKLSSEAPDWLRFQQLGSLAEREISVELQHANFGVTTTPSHLVGKSGSVAAMLAHGLKIIVPRLDKCYGVWHQEFLADERFIPLDDRFTQRLLNELDSGSIRHADINKEGNQVDEIADMLFQSLVNRT
jgi:hypothetical protein